MPPIKLKKESKEMRRPNKPSKIGLEEEIDFYKEVERFVAR